MDPLKATGASIQADTVTAEARTIFPCLCRFHNFQDDVVIIDSTYELSSPFLDMVSDTPVLTFGKRVQALDHQIALTGVNVSFAAAGLTGNAATIAEKVDPLVHGWISGGAVEDQNL